MDGDRRAPAAAASVAAVLGDDDLLREIILRLGFPNYLVSAALVSKRWLLHASNLAFLRRFRDRHPPRLLGFSAGYPGTYRFVPLPQPPELAVVSRRAASSCNDAFAARRGQSVKHCLNGRLITSFVHEGRLRYLLLSPLLAGKPAAVLPPTPVIRRDWEDRPDDAFTEIFLPEDGGSDGITLVNLWRAGGKVYAEGYVLESGEWGVPATAAIELMLPNELGTTFLKAVLPPVHGKVFLVTTSGYTLGLDLATASFFTLKLPNGVGHNYKLSSAENSGLYLVSADGFQLSVWLHRMTTSGDDDAGGWLLEDTFCVRETCKRLAGHNWVSSSGDFVGVVALVGDNTKFVFLDHVTSGVLLYFHLRSRLVEKFHQRAPDKDSLAYSLLGHIRCSPFMMTWPPIFPALNGGHDQQGWYHCVWLYLHWV